MKIFICLFLIGLVGCSAHQNVKDVREAGQESNFTLGTVQKEIKKGMTGAGVIEALGSPNLISKDADDNEVWVYDKISTEKVSSETGGGGSLILVGYGKQTSATSVTQRTLTVIIKFDKNNKVRDFSYHASKY